MTCWALSWCLLEGKEKRGSEPRYSLWKAANKSRNTHGCTVWWCAGSWAAVVCTHGSSSPGRRTWSWGWSSPCSALRDAQRTSTCFPSKWGQDNSVITKENITKNPHPTLSILSSHLFDFSNIPNEGFIIHKLEKLLQLVQVTNKVLTNPLQNRKNILFFHCHDSASK